MRKTIKPETKVNKSIRRMKSKILKNNDVVKAGIFGSYARGEAKKASDVDLIIVSNKFKNKKFRYRSIGFYKYWDLDYPVDFLCYTPKEFEEKRARITIVSQAAKEGVEIA